MATEKVALTVTFDDSFIGEVGEEAPFWFDSYDSANKWRDFLLVSGVARSVGHIYSVFDTPSYYSVSQLYTLANKILEARTKQACTIISTTMRLHTQLDTLPSI